VVKIAEKRSSKKKLSEWERLTRFPEVRPVDRRTRKR
jgi:hypothetical protein